MILATVIWVFVVIDDHCDESHWANKECCFVQSIVQDSILYTLLFVSLCSVRSWDMTAFKGTLKGIIKLSKIERLCFQSLSTANPPFLGRTEHL